MVNDNVVDHVSMTMATRRDDFQQQQLGDIDTLTSVWQIMPACDRQTDGRINQSINQNLLSEQ